MKMFKILSLSFIALAIIFINKDSMAEGAKLPALPKPLETYVEQGAQIKYLGRERGFDSWMTIKAGIEEFYHVPAKDSSTFFMGLMFSEDGSVITFEQVKKLQKNNDFVLNSLVGDSPKEEIEEKIEFIEKTPAQKLYEDVENSNWVAIGNKKAPYIYVFIDPQCPHCHEYLKDMEHKYIKTGLLQLRVVPVGVLTPESKEQAAYILAAKDGVKLLFEYINGNEKALKSGGGIITQGAERNLALLQAWKFDVTPITIYKSGDGQIKLISGRADNINDLVNDLK